MHSTFEIPSRLKQISILLLIVGIVAGVFGFLSNAERAWANYLISNYYFISLVIGATFFLAIQRITQSGWSAMFIRVPEAFAGYLPLAAVFMLVFAFAGLHSIYHWSHEDAIAGDRLLQHKSPWLNSSFFIIRTVLFFGSWIILTRVLRNFSLKEDLSGGNENFARSEFFSKVYIFILALTFSLASFDWIMSIDSHWFSAIFAIKNFVSAFLHGAAAITLVVLLMNKNGYFPELNKHHVHDFSKYIFILSIMWGYTWFSEFFLIWFSNIPEETVYFIKRTSPEWNSLFFAQVALNWMFPFLFLMLNKIAKNKNALILTCIVLLLGFWVDIYIQVMPGSTGVNSIGFTEIGMFAGFAGLFIFSVAKALGNAAVVPVNHPYLQESILHELH